jgi:hypothetical protein
MAQFLKKIKILAGLVLIVTAGARCKAQEIVTELQAARIQVFGLGSGVWTGYEGGKNLSLTGGGDLILRPLFRLQPGLEVRATIPVDSRTIDGQRTFLGGPRVEYMRGRFDPYADFLIGTGTITFVHPAQTPAGLYTTNDSVVYCAGGGLDYTVMRSFAARVEVQEQFWKISKDPGGSFSPISVSIGVVYRFHFGSESR